MLWQSFATWKNVEYQHVGKTHWLLTLTSLKKTLTQGNIKMGQRLTSWSKFLDFDLDSLLNSSSSNGDEDSAVLIRSWILFPKLFSKRRKWWLNTSFSCLFFICFLSRIKLDLNIDCFSTSAVGGYFYKRILWVLSFTLLYFSFLNAFPILSNNGYIDGCILLQILNK